MRIRIIKRPPAPRMDGFDLRGFEVDRVYTVEDGVGRYLIVSGYAERLTSDVQTNDSNKSADR